MDAIGGRRILVVEDERAIVELLRYTLWSQPRVMKPTS
jgi:hypothetical protein